jgi:hypothetical protein
MAETAAAGTRSFIAVTGSTEGKASDSAIVSSATGFYTNKNIIGHGLEGTKLTIGRTTIDSVTVKPDSSAVYLWWAGNKYTAPRER